MITVKDSQMKKGLAEYVFANKITLLNNNLLIIQSINQCLGCYR